MNTLTKTSLASLIATSLLVTLALGSVAAEMSYDAAFDRMQQHWQELIAEPDKDKRRARIAEHQALMDKLNTTHGHGAGMMMGHSNVTREDMRHMTNTLEMHRLMMDMIMK